MNKWTALILSFEINLKIKFWRDGSFGNISAIFWAPSVFSELSLRSKRRSMY